HCTLTHPPSPPSPPRRSPDLPTCHHHTIAGAFLDRGVPLLVEKPLAPTIEQADDLVRLARLRGATLQVGHVERFNPAFEELCGRDRKSTRLNSSHERTSYAVL